MREDDDDDDNDDEPTPTPYLCTCAFHSSWDRSLHLASLMDRRHETTTYIIHSQEGRSTPDSIWGTPTSIPTEAHPRLQPNIPDDPNSDRGDLSTDWGQSPCSRCPMIPDTLLHFHPPTAPHARHATAYVVNQPLHGGAKYRDLLREAVRLVSALQPAGWRLQGLSTVNPTFKQR